MDTATWARRILALVVDWFASTLVVILLLGGVDAWAGDRSPASTFSASSSSSRRCSPR